MRLSRVQQPNMTELTPSGNSRRWRVVFIAWFIRIVLIWSGFGRQCREEARRAALVFSQAWRPAGVSERRATFAFLCPTSDPPAMSFLDSYSHLNKTRLWVKYARVYCLLCDNFHHFRIVTKLPRTVAGMGYPKGILRKANSSLDNNCLAIWSHGGLARARAQASVQC